MIFTDLILTPIPYEKYNILSTSVCKMRCSTCEKLFKSDTGYWVEYRSTKTNKAYFIIYCSETCFNIMILQEMA